MKETVAHILEIAVVVIALMALIAIMINLTKVGKTNADGTTTGSGYITQNVEKTIGNVFDKTGNAIDSSTNTGKQ